MNLRAKIDKVIQDLPNALSLAQIQTTLIRADAFLESLLASQCSDVSMDFLKFCQKHNYPYTTHHETTFRFLEDIAANFRQTIFCIHHDHHTFSQIPFADQVGPISVIIRFLMEDIRRQLNPLLSINKLVAVDNWIADMNDWLTFFQVDAELRLQHQKSLFINNPDFQNWTSKRKNKAYLIEASKQLPHCSECDLRITGPKLFPTDEKSLEWLDQAPFLLIMNLQERLRKEGCPLHADALALGYCIKNSPPNW